MRLTQLFRSTAFRLSLLYMAVFSVSVVLLLMFIYFETSKEMDSQIKQTINSQVGELSATFYQDGAEETVALIQDMMQHDTEDMSLFVFMDKKKKVLAGHVDKWPLALRRDGQWFQFSLPDTEDNSSEESTTYLGRVVTFKGGYKVLVAYNLRHSESIRLIIRNVLLGTLGLTFLVAVGSGSLISRSISRKLEQVNHACRRVMHGHLEQTIPVPGGGDAFDILAENFNAMLAWISDLIRGIENVSHNIAHDLRCPLSRLRTRLESALQHGEMDQDKVKREIKRSLSDLDNLIQTFNAILRISQVEARAGIEHFTQFDISQTLYDIIDFYQPLMEEKRIECQVSIMPDLQLHGDKHLLSQAFANLMDNAVKYSPSRTVLTISLAITEAEMLSCVIADQGPGIPPEFHEKVKQRFFRMDSSRTTQGSGLGLSLVDAVIKLHNGTMHFDNQNPGLKVTIMLPRC